LIRNLLQEGKDKELSPTHRTWSEHLERVVDVELIAAFSLGALSTRQVFGVYEAIIKEREKEEKEGKREEGEEVRGLIMQAIVVPGWYSTSLQ
jgi:hypothetical protein